MGALLLIFSMKQTERASPGEIFKMLYPVYFAMDLHQTLGCWKGRPVFSPTKFQEDWKSAYIFVKKMWLRLKMLQLAYISGDLDHV